MVEDGKDAGLSTPLVGVGRPKPTGFCECVRELPIPTPLIIPLAPMHATSHTLLLPNA